MKDDSNNETDSNSEPYKTERSVQSDVDKIVKVDVDDLAEREKNLNASILSITTKIRDKYPEMYPHIEEMTITIPDKKDPEIAVKHLKDYYDSLNAMLNKYLLEHPEYK